LAIHSLEFADTLVPIFSFLTCLVGLWLIIFSSKLCDNWSKAYRASTAELLNSYHEIHSSYVPKFLSPVTWQVEFKIIHHLFCDKHKMELTSFPFDEYMELQFEKFILEIIEISPITWSLFGVYLLWIYLRKVIPYVVVEMKTEVHRFANSYFASCAFVILFGAIILWMSRYYEVRTMQCKGILSHYHYRSFLLREDRKTKLKLKNRTASTILVEQQQLKEILAQAKSKGQLRHETLLHSDITHAVAEVGNVIGGKSGDHLISVHIGDNIFISVHIGTQGERTQDELSIPTQQSDTKSDPPLAHSDPTDGVYLCSSSWLYFSIMKFQVMNITIHLAVWLVQVLPTQSLGPSYKAVLIIMILVAFALYFIAAKSAVVLHAMHHLDAESLLQVIEQTEGARSLEKEIRDGILKKLKVTDESNDMNVKTQLRLIFNEIDVDNSGQLSRGELTTFLGTLDIHFSKRKWKQVFRLMDRSQQESSNSITFDEFFFFVFPQDPAAVEAEEQRLREEQESERKKSAEERQQLASSKKRGYFNIFRSTKTVIPVSFTSVRALTNSFDDEEGSQHHPTKDHQSTHSEDVAQSHHVVKVSRKYVASPSSASLSDVGAVATNNVDNGVADDEKSCEGGENNIERQNAPGF